MLELFNVTVYSVKTDEQGEVSSGSEKYLFDAVNFTDAEAQGIKFVTDRGDSNAIVTTISRKTIDEIIKGEEVFDNLWEVEVQSIVVMDSGKRKKEYHYVYVGTNDAITAANVAIDYVEGIGMNEVEVKSLSKTTIINYISKEDWEQLDNAQE